MKYAIEMTPHARRQLEKLGAEESGRIVAAIRKLADDPRPSGAKKMSCRPAWRIRVGQFRVIYEIADGTLTVLVVTIGNRRDVYR